MTPTVQLTDTAFVTKQEIREAIFVENAEVDRSDDELNTLYNMINWVCDAVESRVGFPVIQRSYTEYSDGGGEYIFATHTPVVSITSVIESGVALTDGTQYLFDPDLGAVRRTVDDDATSASTFASGPKAVALEYVAGYGVQNRVAGELTSVTGVPEDLKLAVYIWIQHLWAKGPANYTPEQGHATGSRAAIPYEVKEILTSRSTGIHWIGM